MADQFSPERGGRFTKEELEQIGHQAEQEEYPVDRIFQLGKAALERSEFESDSAYAEIFQDAPNPSYELTTTKGEKLTLSRGNTLIYEYPHYPEFDHVFHTRNEEDSTVHIYFWKDRQPKVFQAIKDKGFDLARLNRPTEPDYKLWLNAQLEDSGLSV